MSIFGMRRSRPGRLPHQALGLILRGLSATILVCGPAAAGNPPYVAPAVSVTQRAPLPTDDATKGYTTTSLTAGNLWQWNRRSWRLVSSTAGQASWLETTVRALPLDAVSGGYGWSSRKLSASYTGKAFIVTRASDSTTSDIGFLPSGDLDTATLWAFCAGTTCRATTIHYQAPSSAGNTTYDLVQSTVASAFLVTPGNATGAGVSFVADSFPEASGAYQFYTLPSGLSLTNRSHSIFMAARVLGGHQVSLTTLGTSSGYFTFGSYVNSINGLGVGYFGSCASTLPATQSAAVLGYVAASTGYTTWSNDVATTCALTGGNASLAGGWLGANTSGQQTGHWEVSGVLMFPTALTTAQQLTIQSAMYEDLNLFPQVRDTVATTGDSIWDSYNASANQNILRQMEPFLSRPARLFNFGYYGSQLGTQRCSAAEYAADSAKAFQAGAQNIYVVQGSWNDIRGQSFTTGSQMYAIQQACAAQARGTGYQGVVAVDLLNNNGQAATPTAVQQAFDALAVSSLAAGAFYADRLVDFLNDPVLGAAGSTTNAGLFAADGQHLTTTGYAIAAQQVARAVNGLLH